MTDMKPAFDEWHERAQMVPANATIHQQAAIGLANEKLAKELARKYGVRAQDIINVPPKRKEPLPATPTAPRRMVEVHPNLFVGAAPDLLHATGPDGDVKEGWYVISAAKDPWHREALGYTTRGAPKDHPEYLVAARPYRLILNLIDPDDPKYIPDEIVDGTLQVIDVELASGAKVLLHCNQGMSRAPSLALLWLHSRPPLDAGESQPWGALDFDEAVEEFRKLYPMFNPSSGWSAYLKEHW